MIAVIQRVEWANVVIEEKKHNEIGKGLVVLLGIEKKDEVKDVLWMSKKITQMRIFSDDAEKMNLSVCDVKGDILLISQFTLCANIKKGNRPSFIEAAEPSKAFPLYENMITQIEKNLQRKIKTGKFGANMQVNLCNSGPVTLTVSSLGALGRPIN